MAYVTPKQSAQWLRMRMDECGYTSLDDLAVVAGIDKGNVSRIFRQLQRPRVDVLELLASALQVNVYELLIQMGVVDPDRRDVPPVQPARGRVRAVAG
jgi:transcriptional regulator with XRE-family HTH domain